MANAVKDVKVSVTSKGTNVTGTAANDVIVASGGSDHINGGKGIDTVLFNGSVAAYQVIDAGHGNSQKITVIADDGAVTKLKNVESLQFLGDSHPSLFGTSGDDTFAITLAQSGASITT